MAIVEKTPSLAERIAQTLKRRIVEGKWLGDAKLPSERELGLEFNVSSSTIKKALYELRRDGDIRSHQGKGYFVNSCKRPRRTHVIAVIIFDSIHTQHPVMQARLRGIEAVLSEHEYHMAVFALKRPAVEDSRLWMGVLDPSTVDGVILVAQGISPSHVDALASQVPVCWCDSRHRTSRIFSVRLDYTGGVMLAVEHLWALGHRHIAFCAPDIPFHQIADAQREGFRLGMSMRAETHVSSVIATSGYTREGGKKAARKSRSEEEGASIASRLAQRQEAEGSRRKRKRSSERTEA